MRIQFRHVAPIALVVLMLAFAVGGTSAGGDAPPVQQAQGVPVQFNGVIQALGINSITVNGQMIDISQIQITSPLRIGLTVAVNGILTPENRIVASSVSVLNSPPPAPTLVPTQVVVGQPGAVADGDCALGHGYWKNHRDMWPVTTVTLGSQQYSQDEALGLLNAPVIGDASIILAHQLVASKLSIAGGTNPAPASNIIGQADQLLGRFDAKLPYNIHPSSDVGQMMTSIAGVLDSYNNNLMTPNCEQTVVDDGADDQDDDHLGSRTVIIEGPVQAINGSVVRVYDIDIIFDQNDPILQVIRVGDTIRVQGFSDDTSTNITMLTVVSVMFINGEVDVREDGETFRDEGNCDNPPPDWARARGWRHRCEGAERPGNGNGNGNGNGMGMGMGMGDDD